jgi:hypothetical protein
MNPTRRDFFAGIAGVGSLTAAHQPGLILEAISAPRLPHTLTVGQGHALPALTAGFFELREYQSASRLRLDQLHEKFLSGTFPRPLLWERGDNLRYLFRFDSLAVRAEAWTAFASDPAWIRFREEGDAVRVANVSIYGAARRR